MQDLTCRWKRRACAWWIGEGKVIREGKLVSDPDAIELFLAEWGIHLKRIGLEAFSFSGWLFTGLYEKGLPVVCIETRHAKAAMNAMLNKTDKNDARGIAQMMRTGWFRAVHVKSGEAQTLRALLVGRKAMLGKVIDMENMIRGLLRPFGLKVGHISTGQFDARIRELVAGRWPSWKPSSRHCWTRDTRCGCSWPSCIVWQWWRRVKTRQCGG